MARYYNYKFSNGESRFMTPETAKSYAIEKELQITYDGLKFICENVQSSSHRDIYKGYNPGLGMEIRSKQHYNQVLKERGLTEVGNEQIKIEKKYKSYIDDKVAREIINSGANVSEREIDAIRSGEKLHKE